MSLATRQAIVDSPLTFFQRDSQRSDLIDPGVTQTGLIALILFLLEKGWALEFTAIKSDHGDDSALGEHCHHNGYCADLWPLASLTAGDYLDASDGRFQQFLRDCAAAVDLYQIGLAGSADTAENRNAAGATVFEDDGADHVHLGAVNP